MYCTAAIRCRRPPTSIAAHRDRQPRATGGRPGRSGRESCALTSRVLSGELEEEVADRLAAPGRMALQTPPVLQDRRLVGNPLGAKDLLDLEFTVSRFRTRKVMKGPHVYDGDWLRAMTSTAGPGAHTLVERAAATDLHSSCAFSVLRLPSAIPAPVPGRAQRLAQVAARRIRDRVIHGASVSA